MEQKERGAEGGKEPEGRSNHVHEGRKKSPRGLEVSNNSERDGKKVKGCAKWEEPNETNAKEKPEMKKKGQLE
jgi:hypothetical protein